MPREGNQLAELLVTDVGAGNGMHHCALVTHFSHLSTICPRFFQMLAFFGGVVGGSSG